MKPVGPFTLHVIKTDCPLKKDNRNGLARIFPLDLPHAGRMWYHYTTCLVATLHSVCLGKSQSALFHFREWRGL
eukprot:6225687-Amphidinium_carterae.1